jgi:hypothetical protein
MPNTLDLDDEWDDVELIESLQRAFDIKFDPDEINGIANVGSLFNIVERELGIPNGQKKCVSAMAFYRLRRALRSMDEGMKLEPETDLNGFGKLSARAFLKGLCQSTGLHMPRQGLSWVGNVGGSILLLALLALFPVAVVVNMHMLESRWGWTLASGFACSFTLLFLDPGRLPKGSTTLGGLSKKVAVLNYGRLSKLGARSDKASLWDNFVELICELSNLPKNEINAETVFFRHQLKAA